MDVAVLSSGSDITCSESVSSQQPANGKLPQHTGEAPPPVSEGLEDGDSCDDTPADVSNTNDVTRLLPSQPASTSWKQKGLDSSSVPPPPICTPPAPSSETPPLPPPPPPCQSSTCNRQSLGPPHHHRHHQQSSSQKRLSSTRSTTSLRTDAAHIKEVAGDDCCAHCLLACLFCEVLSMCSALGECLACGAGGACCCDCATGCCCVEAAGEAACTEEACQAVLDCGIVEGCCGSSDCLEICLECCSICFPT